MGRFGRMPPGHARGSARWSWPPLRSVCQHRPLLLSNTQEQLRCHGRSTRTRVQLKPRSEHAHSLQQSSWGGQFGGTAFRESCGVPTQAIQIMAGPDWGIDGTQRYGQAPERARAYAWDSSLTLLPTLSLDHCWFGLANKQGQVDKYVWGASADRCWELYQRNGVRVGSTGFCDKTLPSAWRPRGRGQIQNVQ